MASAAHAPPCHPVSRSKARVPGKRSRFEIKQTREETWVAVSKKEGNSAKPPSWGNILKWVRDPDLLNNRVVKLVWQVKVHLFGTIRLERPSLVWNTALELTTGKVLRIA